MIRIAFIGTGRIASALVKAYKQTNVEILGAFHYKPDKLKDFCATHNIEALNSYDVAADVTFLAVPDQAISEVSGKVNQQSIIVHCSGSWPLDKIKAPQKAVFWPIQSFSNQVNYNFNQIPVCIEASSEENLRIVEQLADKISKKVIHLNYEKRQWLHLSAVIVNNFTNHLYAEAHSLLNKHQLDFNLLLPLIQETVNKLNWVEPRLAQTGPAVRQDLSTIVKHLTLLSDSPELRQLYELMSASISKTK